ncbi:MAG: hypothetical protein ACLSWI_00030, partial [Candidatus Gastranaerophilaceae bacterium]
MKKIFYTVFLLIISGIFSVSNAAIKVTPTILELNTNNARSNYLTASFDIQGDKNETIRFKVYPEYFKISQTGTMDIYENTDEADSLIKNARFVPNEFTLQNGKSQKVRLTIANLNTLKDGESRMVLFLEDVAAKELFLPSGQKDVQTKLLIKTRVGIPVYVDKGRFVKCAKIDTLNVEKNKNEINAALKIISEGNSKVRYTGKAQIIKDKKLIAEYPIKSNVVGSNSFLFTSEDIPIENITESGEYTLRMILNYSDEKGKLKNLIKENKFTIENT